MMFDECLYDGGGFEPTEWHEVTRRADGGGFELSDHYAEQLERAGMPGRHG